LTDRKLPCTDKDGGYISATDWFKPLRSKLPRKDSVGTASTKSSSLPAISEGRSSTQSRSLSSLSIGQCSLSSISSGRSKVLVSVSAPLPLHCTPSPGFAATQDGFNPLDSTGELHRGRFPMTSSASTGSLHGAPPRPVTTRSTLRETRLFPMAGAERNERLEQGSHPWGSSRERNQGRCPMMNSTSTGFLHGASSRQTPMQSTLREAPLSQMATTSLKFLNARTHGLCPSDCDPLCLTLSTEDMGLGFAPREPNPEHKYNTGLDGMIRYMRQCNDLAAGCTFGGSNETLLGS